MPDRGIELAGFELTGFPFIPRPWKTCCSFVSYGQVATEPARLLLQMRRSSPDAGPELWERAKETERTAGRIFQTIFDILLAAKSK
jgi:hypothetical protein